MGFLRFVFEGPVGLFDVFEDFLDDCEAGLDFREWSGERSERRSHLGLGVSGPGGYFAIGFVLAEADSGLEDGRDIFHEEDENGGDGRKKEGRKEDVFGVSIHGDLWGAVIRVRVWLLGT
jgi:hypothetical protein